VASDDEQYVMTRENREQWLTQKHVSRESYSPPSRGAILAFGTRKQLPIKSGEVSNLTRKYICSEVKRRIGFPSILSSFLWILHQPRRLVRVIRKKKTATISEFLNERSWEYGSERFRNDLLSTLFSCNPAMEERFRSFYWFFRLGITELLTFVLYPRYNRC
jgi:hypothetical protein